MGASYYICRKDNQTAFDLGKHYCSDYVLPYIYSPGELYESLWLRLMPHWLHEQHRGEADSVPFQWVGGIFLVRDRLLEFWDGAKASDLVYAHEETYWEQHDWPVTHDVYWGVEEALKYFELIGKDDDAYKADPIAFFKRHEMPRGKCLEDANGLRKSRLEWNRKREERQKLRQA